MLLEPSATTDSASIPFSAGNFPRFRKGMDKREAQLEYLWECLSELEQTFANAKTGEELKPLKKRLAVLRAQIAKSEADIRGMKAVRKDICQRTGSRRCTNADRSEAGQAASTVTCR